MSTYTYITLTHFDECTGESFTQDYRWSWQTCPCQGDQYIELEANAGTADASDWIFENGLNDQRDLSHWLKQQERESARAREIWETDQAELA
jgi:hypothetical protein